MRSLTKVSFLHSINTYYLTSRQSADDLWTEELLPSNDAVQRFKARVHDGFPQPQFLTFGDAHNHWIDCWEAKVRPLFAVSPRCPAPTHPPSLRTDGARGRLP